MQATSKANLRWATHHMAHKSLIQLLINKELPVDIGPGMGLDIPVSHRMVAPLTGILEPREVQYSSYQAVALELDGQVKEIDYSGTGQDCNLRLLGLLSGISMLLAMKTSFSNGIRWFH